MSDNPFEDPAVQMAAGGSPEIPRTYGQSDAYDDPTDINITAEQQLALNVGSAAAKSQANAVRSDYDQSMETQGNVNERPETPNCCIKCWNWFPLNLFALIGGLMLIALPLIDMIFNKSLTFFSFCIFTYLLVFGVMIVFIESPSFKLTRWMQLKLYFWFRFLGRMWGRSWFYLFSSILCYAEITNSGSLSAPIFAGFYLTVICILGFIFSRISGKVHRRIYEFVAAGAEVDSTDELAGRFMRKFDELDTDGDGKIGSKELVVLGKQANRDMSNSVRHAIQTFLDESCNGFVSKEDWMKQWLLYENTMKFL